MHTPVCRHVKINGRQCKSPALTGSPLCYFHAKLHKRHRKLRDSAPENAEAATGSLVGLPETGPITPKNVVAAQASLRLALPALEDADSVQVSISLVIAALASGQIEPSRARVLLYGLQLASANARSTTTEPFNVVRHITLLQVRPRPRLGLELQSSHRNYPPELRSNLSVVLRRRSVP